MRVTVFTLLCVNVHQRRRAAAPLQELCREIHHKIDVIDEERYDLETKVSKCNKEVGREQRPRLHLTEAQLLCKVVEIKTKIKRKKVAYCSHVVFCMIQNKERKI